MGKQSQGRTHPSTASAWAILRVDWDYSIRFTQIQLGKQDSGPQFNDHVNGIVNGGIFYEAQGSIELIVDTVTLQ